MCYALVGLIRYICCTSKSDPTYLFNPPCPPPGPQLPVFLFFYPPERFIFDKALPTVGRKFFKTESMYDNIKTPLVTIFADIDLEKNPKGWTYLSNR